MIVTKLKKKNQNHFLWCVTIVQFNLFYFQLENLVFIHF